MQPIPVQPQPEQNKDGTITPPPAPTQPLANGVRVATDGTPLMFPGYEGLPFRGNTVPILRQEELETKLQVVGDGHARSFNFNKPEDVAEYNRIIDNVAKGIYEISMEKVDWSERENAYVSFVRWVQYQVEPRNAVYERAQSVKGQLVFGT